MMRKMVLLMIGVLLVFGLVGCMSEDNLNDVLGNIPGTFSVDGMVYVPAMTFPTGTNDSGLASVNEFYIARTEVTFSQWKKVYDWAINHGYSFANSGEAGKNGTGDDMHPVTEISWQDAVVWCNALTEYYNNTRDTKYTCVYYANSSSTTPIRVGHEDPYAKFDATGFRLPTEWEWGLAARLIKDKNGDGKLDQTGEYYPGNYASGASAATSDSTATSEVAWFDLISGNTTHQVGTKKNNALGLWDMSGNVKEWCWDWHDDYWGLRRVVRGYSFDTNAEYLQIGINDSGISTDAGNSFGFRVARNKTDGKTCTISFRCLRAETLANPLVINVIKGETCTTLPAEPNKAGDTFGGWFTGVGGSGIEFTTNTVVSNSLTVYANWISVYPLRSAGPAGGRVFYDKGFYSNGWRFIEAAPTDQDVGAYGAGIGWGSFIVTGATNFAIGTGQENTTLIVNSQGGSAAQLCNDLVIGSYSNWFLPSGYELIQMYLNLKIYGVGGFASESYWSSTEISIDHAFSKGFSHGNQNSLLKNNAFSWTRAVRNF